MEPPRCFISYAREDLDRVRPIVKLIEDNGWSVFWDRTIPAGLTWRGYIGKALDEAKCVIVVWSRKSVVSEFVQEEADDGRERRILIPISIDDVRPPLGFRAIQHEDFTKWKGESHNRRAKSLLKAIEGIAGKPQKKTIVSPASSRKKEPSTPKRKTSFFFKLGPMVVSLTFAAVILTVGLNFWLKDQNQPKPPSPAAVKEPSAKKKTTASPQIESKKEIPKADTDLPKTFQNSIGMEFVLIPAGSFEMGSGISPEEVVRRYGGKAEWYKNEYPQHSVEITKPFYLQKTEVTQGQWKKVMGDNPSRFKDCGDDCPVEQVSWNDTKKFIKKLNDLEGTDKYRLPTEAEWEYAARAGATVVYSFGDDAGQLGEYVWFYENSNSQTHPVGGKKPNSWRLYDMLGNVWEWVEDDWHDTYNPIVQGVVYRNAPAYGHAWIDEPRGVHRVIRGGSWRHVSRFCRPATRDKYTPDNRNYYIGFRLARSVTLGP